MIRNVDVQICLKVTWTESTVRQVNSCLRFEKQSTRDSRQRSTAKIISCLKADESKKKSKQYFNMQINITVCHTQDSICKNFNLHLIPFSKWDVHCISVVFIGCYQTLQDQSGLSLFFVGRSYIG